MSDLISRQAAIDAWKADFKGYVDSLDLLRDDYNGIMEYIDETPSAQPEIIHCRDCKWHNGEIDQCNVQICASMCSEDFCSKAERREE